MGTRSLTFVYEEAFNPGDEPQPIINLYRQYDGYPTGHGAELAEFLSTVKSNGMSCLAAQLVANFKDGPGQFYLYPVTAKDCGQDYEYHIYQQQDTFRVVVGNKGCNIFGLTMSDKNDYIFDGNVKEFVNFCTKKEEIE